MKWTIKNGWKLLPKKMFNFWQCQTFEESLNNRQISSFMFLYYCPLVFLEYGFPWYLTVQLPTKTEPNCWRITQNKHTKSDHLLFSGLCIWRDRTPFALAVHFPLKTTNLVSAVDWHLERHEFSDPIARPTHAHTEERPLRAAGGRLHGIRETDPQLSVCV